MNKLWAEHFGLQWGKEGREPPLTQKGGGEAVPTPSSASGDEAPHRELAAAGRLAGLPSEKSHRVLSENIDSSVALGSKHDPLQYHVLW